MTSEKNSIESPSFIARRLPQSSEWYVLVTWPDGHTDRVTGFRSGAEAFLWIEQESHHWLAARQNISV